MTLTRTLVILSYLDTELGRIAMFLERKTLMTFFWGQKRLKQFFQHEDYCTRFWPVSGECGSGLKGLRDLKFKKIKTIKKEACKRDALGTKWGLL
jgi:hypothetical protein